jgi:hypothetical protein
MADVKISPEVADVLRGATVVGNAVCLPDAQLPRPLYEAVDKALRAAGGRWKRGKGHLFESCPTAKLSAMLGSGVSIDERKKFQAFYTPPHLAERVAALASLDEHVVLEPSAGQGALARACLGAGASWVYCIELNPENEKHLEGEERTVEIADFLTLPPPAIKYSRIVMNPPFTRGSDIKHVTHALKWLADGGRLVAIVAPGHLDEWDDVLDGYEWEREDVPAGAFRESGTEIATQILTIGYHPDPDDAPWAEAAH